MRRSVAQIGFIQIYSMCRRLSYVTAARLRGIERDGQQQRAEEFQKRSKTVEILANKRQVLEAAVFGENRGPIRKPLSELGFTGVTDALIEGPINNLRKPTKRAHAAASLIAMRNPEPVRRAKSVARMTDTSASWRNREGRRRLIKILRRYDEDRRAFDRTDSLAGLGSGELEIERNLRLGVLERIVFLLSVQRWRGEGPREPGRPRTRQLEKELRALVEEFRSLPPEFDRLSEERRAIEKSALRRIPMDDFWNRIRGAIAMEIETILSLERAARPRFQICRACRIAFDLTGPLRSFCSKGCEDSTKKSRDIASGRAGARKRATRLARLEKGRANRL